MTGTSGDDDPLPPGLDDSGALRRASRRSVVIVVTLFGVLVLLAVGAVASLQLVPDEDVVAAKVCGEFERNLRIAAPPLLPMDTTDIEQDAKDLTGRWASLGPDMVAVAHAFRDDGIATEAGLERARAAVRTVLDRCAEVPPIAELAARI